MSEGRNISVKTKVDVAIMQAAGIRCPLCSKYLMSGDPRILEHMVPRALFTILHKRDAKENLRWVHKRCAVLKTNGTKATCADGDIHKIAKAKRIAAGGKKRRGPPMKSAPMRRNTKLKRKMDGSVVERT